MLITSSRQQITWSLPERPPGWSWGRLPCHSYVTVAATNRHHQHQSEALQSRVSRV